MLSLERMQAPASGLAHPLDQLPRLSAQNAFSLDEATARSEQQKAITNLLDQQDDSIFAYLKFDRSLDQRFPGHGSLSSDQVLAIRVLKHCDDDEIRTWLSQARKISSAPNQPQPSLGDATQEPGFRPLSTSEQLKDSYRSALNASDTQPHQTPHGTKTSREVPKAANRYWCTICEDPKSYKKLSDWKKHERGHVRTYLCMLDGPLEETEGGHNCILCGFFNPSKEHLDGHKLNTCGKGVPGSFANKRRGKLVDHLVECHNVQGKVQAQAIAHKWQAKTREQAWSCGFCAHLVHNFEERLRHIALHFDHGQTLDDWDATKVVKGLLSQSGMVGAWKTQLAASSLDWRPSGISWEKRLIKNIQHDLEMGPSDFQHAEVLAKAAYQASQFRGHSIINEHPLAFAPVHGLQRPSAVVPSSGYHSIMELDSMPNSNHASSQYIANPAEALHHDIFALDGVLETPSNYAAFPASSSDGGSNTIERSRLHSPGQTWTSAANQYTGFNGYQGHSNAATGSHCGPTPPEFSNEPNFDEMCE